MGTGPTPYRIPVGYFIVLGTIVFLPICLVVGYFSGAFYDLGITPCSPPPGMMVDGGAFATVLAFEDIDRNGKWDAAEPALSGVEARVGADDQITDETGRARLMDFRAGCVCKCWEGSSVVVEVPAGYAATTPTEMPLTGHALEYAFGFRRLR